VSRACFHFDRYNKPGMNFFVCLHEAQNTAAIFPCSELHISAHFSRSSSRDIDTLLIQLLIYAEVDILSIGALPFVLSLHILFIYLFIACIMHLACIERRERQKNYPPYTQFTARLLHVG
jgi:hypothetical protein